MHERRARAAKTEDLARLFVERANAGDAGGLAELYEPDAVLGYPPGQLTVGQDAIRTVYQQMLSQPQRVQFQFEEPLPTVRRSDLALTGRVSVDTVGGRS